MVRKFDTRWPRLAASALCIAAATAGAAKAQHARAGLCMPRGGAIGGVEIFDCPGGLALTAEAGAVFSLVDADRDGTPEGAELSEGALLLQGGAFTVSTPSADALVKGTALIAHAAAGRLSVFVETGRVAVKRRGGDGASVELGDGEGVDVAGPDAPLTVRRWSPARVSALFRRLGRP